MALADAILTDNEDEADAALSEAFAEEPQLLAEAEQVAVTPLQLGAELILSRGKSSSASHSSRLRWMKVAAENMMSQQCCVIEKLSHYVQSMVAAKRFKATALLEFCRYDETPLRCRVDWGPVVPMLASS